MISLRTLLAVLLLLGSASLWASPPLHEVLYQWELGPAQVNHTELTETADGSFVGSAVGGGALDLGCVFRMTRSGGISVLVHFTRNGATNKGARPRGRLVMGNDGAYYGMTQQGGANDFGTIFKVTLGGQLTTLVEFTGDTGSFKGARPGAGLTIGSDGAFYGTTRTGGAHGDGTVFRMTPAGDFTTLAEFNYFGENSNGASPSAALTAGSDGNLYGTTRSGGANQIGTIFQVTPSGTLTTLVSFTGDGATNRGSYPEGSLIESGGSFYGTTTYGGANGFGTVFKVTMDGVLTTLVEFTGNGAANKGSTPTAGLTPGSDGALYGVTANGGANDFGTIFKMTAGGDLTTLVEFTQENASSRGAGLYAGLALGTDGAFYGATGGGGRNGQGTIFKVTAEGTLTTLVNISSRGAMELGGVPNAGLALGGDHSFYGTTYVGGAYGFGTIFKITPGGEFTRLVNFTGTSGLAKGAYPVGRLVAGPDGSMYGTTSLGGAGNFGTIFKMTEAGDLTTLAEFTGTSGGAKGEGPKAGLTLGSDGNFYGTTEFGGASGALGRGTVFKMTGAGEFTTLVQFTGNGAADRGAFPNGELTEGDVGVFYGTTLGGGAKDDGTIFKVTDAGVLTTLVDLYRFGGAVPGGSPVAALSLGADGNFYGSTTSGGVTSGGSDSGPGLIFRMTPSGEISTLLELTGDFAPNKGREILGALVLGVDGNFYGTSSRGGVRDGGTIFKLTPAGRLTTLVEFGNDETFTFWAGPADGLVLGADGYFYGTTFGGGPGGGGTIFRLRVQTSVERQVLAATGSAVAGEPAGTTFRIIGKPSLDPLGGAAFTATLRTASGKVNAVLAGDPPQVIARAGDVAPGTGGAIFERFDLPLISEAGIAFSAKLLHGPGIGAANDTGVWTTVLGNGLTLVVRTGGDAPGVAGGALKRIRAFSLRGAEIALSLQLNATANDDVLVHLDANGATRLLREGDPVDAGNGAKPVAKISVFTPSADAPGQDRWHAPGVLAAVVTFADGKTAVLELRPGQPPRVLATNRSQAPADIGQGHWLAFGLPAVGAAGKTAIRGQQRAGTGEVSVSDDQTIVASDDDATQLPVMRENNPVSGLAGVRLGRPGDPVINEQGLIAFLAALRGDGVIETNHTSLWSGPRGGLQLVACSGNPAPDTAGAALPGVRYASFKYFGLPDGTEAGPLFVATLTGGDVTAKNQTALFGTGSDGLVRLLLRTGDRLDVAGVSRKVAAFAALTGGGRPVGVRRAVAKVGSVAALVTFTDFTQAMVRINYP